MNKQELKKSLFQSIDSCLGNLYQCLAPTSEYFNDIIHLNMRYQRVRQDENKGVISLADRNLELNKIQVALIEFVDSLDSSDFQSIDTIVVEQPAEKTQKSFEHFWSSFFEQKTSIVIGTYYSERFRAWEASTLMATGDAMALGTIMGALNNRGIRDIDVIPTYNFSGDRYQHNLILLGGPDANIITREVYERIDTKFSFGDPDNNEISLSDTFTAVNYSPTFSSRNEVIGDYGLVFKTKNPFNQESEVIILAGCFGFGTNSASMLFDQNSLIQQIEDSHGKHFEALVFSDVIKDWVQKPKIVESYSL